MFFNLFFAVFHHLITIGVSMGAEIDLPDLQKTINTMKKMYKTRRGARLPSEDEFNAVEQKVGAIPEDLKRFYGACSNLIIRGWDIQQVVGGEKAPLIAFVECAKLEGVDINNLLPFCPSDELYICIQRQSQKIFYLNSFEHKKSDDSAHYPSLAAWLNTEVLSTSINSPNCGKI